MIPASFAIMIPVPEPSSRIVKGFGASSTSRSGHELGSDGLERAFLLRLKFGSTGSDNDVVDRGRRRRCCRRAAKGLGGSNSIQASVDSRYAVSVYAASLGCPSDEFRSSPEIRVLTRLYRRCRTFGLLISASWPRKYQNGQNCFRTGLFPGEAGNLDLPWPLVIGGLAKIFR